MRLSGAMRRVGVVALGLVASCGGRATTSGFEDARGGESSSSLGGASPSVGGMASGARTSSSGRGNASGAPGHGGLPPGNSGTGGGASAGAPSAGGSSSSVGGSQGGVSGAGSAGLGGNTGSAGAPVGAVSAACTRLCKQLESCGEGGGLGPTCELDCASNITAGSLSCVDLGLAMSSCLEGSRGFNPDCTESFFRAAQSHCYKAVIAHQECVSGASGVALEPLLCAHISGATASGCVEDRKCLDSAWYNLQCSPTDDGGSTCTCKVHGDFVPDSTWTKTVNEPTTDACRKHIEACLSGNPPSP